MGAAVPSVPIDQGGGIDIGGHPVSLHIGQAPFVLDIFRIPRRQRVRVKDVIIIFTEFFPGILVFCAGKVVTVPGNGDAVVADTSNLQSAFIVLLVERIFVQVRGSQPGDDGRAIIGAKGTIFTIEVFENPVPAVASIVEIPGGMAQCITQLRLVGVELGDNEIHGPLAASHIDGQRTGIRFAYTGRGRRGRSVCLKLFVSRFGKLDLTVMRLDVKRSIPVVERAVTRLEFKADRERLTGAAANIIGMAQIITGNLIERRAHVGNQHRPLALIPFDENRPLH